MNRKEYSHATGRPDHYRGSSMNDTFTIVQIEKVLGLPRWLSGKECTCQFRR